ncbi:MAG: hypothetical protein ABFS23_02400 [Pseudomonadota bacterium]
MPGYTLLLTVPPDLPVFLHLAVAMCRQQDPSHLVETVVVPDRFNPSFRQEVAAAAAAWPEGRIRLVEPSYKDRLLRPVLRAASFIHWQQLVIGAGALRTTHAILHDVDLFMLESGFLRSLYETCRDGNYACVGSGPMWEGHTWAKLPRFAHVVPLWELTFELDWMRANPPHAQRPQYGEFPEGTFWFETSLLAQAHTEPHRIARHRESDLVHFGWVIGGYRAFQTSSGGFEDTHFGLLLIRLLADALDAGGSYNELPSHRDLVEGLDNPNRRVFYADAASSNYRGFRQKLERILKSNLLDAESCSAMRTGLAPFDAAFGRNP